MLQWNPVYTGVIRRTRLVMLVARVEGAGDHHQNQPGEATPLSALPCYRRGNFDRKLGRTVL